MSGSSISASGIYTDVKSHCTAAGRDYLQAQGGAFPPTQSLIYHTGLYVWKFSGPKSSLAFGQGFGDLVRPCDLNALPGP